MAALKTVFFGIMTIFWVVVTMFALSDLVSRIYSGLTQGATGPVVVQSIDLFQPHLARGVWEEVATTGGACRVVGRHLENRIYRSGGRSIRFFVYQQGLSPTQDAAHFVWVLREAQLKQFLARYRNCGVGIPVFGVLEDTYSDAALRRVYFETTGQELSGPVHSGLPVVTSRAALIGYKWLQLATLLVFSVACLAVFAVLTVVFARAAEE